jgi:predicted TIM-barrel fold metal-dependent hydrolase
VAALPFLLFDADNHYYEALDAFTRHLEPGFEKRCMQWAELSGRTRLLVGGRVNRFIPNPTFDPVAKPGCLDAFYRGRNPEGADVRQLFGELDPIQPGYRDRDARLALMDGQGIERCFLFPTLGVGMEQALRNDLPAQRAAFRAFNRWLAEDWGFAYRERLYAAPYLTLSDPDEAVRELEWALERDARVLVLRPSPIRTRDGWRSPCDERFDPFWARVDEAGITVVAHVGSTGYTANGYGGNSTIDALGGGRKPTVAGLIPERAIYDFLLTFAYDKMFERFPNLRIASVENGAGFLRDLFVKLEHSKQRMRWYYEEDPAELFLRNVWINPFWEDEIPVVIEHMGADRVIYGSDWPHMEGMEHPRDILEELEGVSLADQEKILHRNTKALTERRPA